MGLTVHFKMVAPPGTTETQAKQLVESMRLLAGRSFYMQGLVDDVGPVTSDRKILRRNGVGWLKLPIPGRPNVSNHVEVHPTTGFMFQVEVGRDCEPFRLGLCQYPSKVWFQSNDVRTKMLGGWQLSGFSKTQFASLNGWEHFLRCHCAVVEILAGCRKLGLRVKISDEGEYWPGRSIAKLRQNLDQMNGAVAAAAGAMRDIDEAANGKSGIQSPIFAHRQFERLEAEGAMRIGPMLKKLREAAGKV